MKTLHEILRSFGLRRAQYVQDVFEAASSDKLNSYFELEFSKAIKSDSALIFVVAEWGAGKTFQLFCYEKAHKKEGYGPVYRSFFGIQTIDQALANTVTFLPRFNLLLVTILTIFSLFKAMPYLLSANKLSIAGALLITAVGTIFTSFLFFKNKMQVLYTISTILTLCFRHWGNTKRIVILDDLERSSLNSREVWTFLSELFLERHKYIIPLGYSNLEEKLNILSGIKKLNGTLISLPVTNKAKFDLAKEIDADFPFQLHGDLDRSWLSYFSMRDIVSTFTPLFFKGENYDKLIKKFLITQAFYKALLNALGISIQTHLRSTTFDKGNKPQITVRINANIPTPQNNFATAAIYSFFETMSQELKSKFYDIRQSTDIAYILTADSPGAIIQKLTDLSVL